MIASKSALFTPMYAAYASNFYSNCHSVAPYAIFITMFQLVHLAARLRLLDHWSPGLMPLTQGTTKPNQRNAHAVAAFEISQFMQCALGLNVMVPTFTCICCLVEHSAGIAHTLQSGGVPRCSRDTHARVEFAVAGTLAG